MALSLPLAARIASGGLDRHGLGRHGVLERSVCFGRFGVGRFVVGRFGEEGNRGQILVVGTEAALEFNGHLTEWLDGEGLTIGGCR